LYGTTYEGGADCSASALNLGCGVVFELLPPAAGKTKWTEQVLHFFSGVDGASPQAGVIFDDNGNLYGTTSQGGGGYGVVFELSPPAAGQISWTETVLYKFTGKKDGCDPTAGLIFDSAGNLYGTTSGAYSNKIGSSCGLGTVFKLTP
jgi:hypothetical protein